MPFSTSGSSGASRQIRVLLADDHELIRVGLARLVSSQPDLTVVGMAADGQEAVLVAALEQPDVVVMDLSMPLLDGVGATREIGQVSAATKVLVLSSYVERAVIASAVAAGACGYLVKDVSALEVLEAIRRTHRGETVFSAGVRP